MGEIERIPWNGFNVVSTFSGAGGSCLGYRMAGYKVRWASEFIPAAQDTYRANHKGTFLNTKDIREVTAAEILEESGLDEVDLLDGSPPCASFSTNGKREKYWGKVKSYSDSSQVVDDLFFEYTRILEGLQPKVFVAENVSGLVKGTAKGYFKRIIKEMKSCGYEVKARLLDLSMLGVPQKRERLIFVGVRNDLCEKFGVHPVHPKPDAQVYTVADALEGLVNTEEELAAARRVGTKTGVMLERIPKNPDRIIRGNNVSENRESWFNLCRLSWKKPSPTIVQGANQFGYPDEDRMITLAECKRIMSIPDDFICTGSPSQQWERCGRMVPPVMMSRIAKTIEEEILCKTV